MKCTHRARIPPIPSHRLESLDYLAVRTPCYRGQEICSQGRSADSWYGVIGGVARRYVLRSDGRRQIVDLLLPGDFFGFSVVEEYDFTVEAAADDTIVLRYPRRQVETLADASPRLAREIRLVVFEALFRQQTQLLSLGRITAVDKVGSFLLEMAERLSKGRIDQFVLPVSRYDIADYLAVSVETVSRALTDLRHRGVITLSSPRSVRIVDRDAIEQGEWHTRAGQFVAGHRKESTGRMHALQLGSHHN